ncbi:hypothetical protein HN789_05160 [archaeon]|jgi:hypothetical protein|nr:hypothetical protein [archaeon]MBT4022900.1 hypothetical protein [archaeon]MBT4272547.1 hypothetical protein [archaeon]MBT4460385.1 hypothetical protein [archaeon]MBT4859016.1 hypothetical protein [archaeon]
MMTIKIMVTLSTIILGTLLTKNELKALFSCVTEREYVDIDEFGRIASKTTNSL